MNKIEINLDMDGVLADWTALIMAHPLCSHLKGDIKLLNKGNDRCGIINRIYKNNPDFFNRLPVIEESHIILSYLATLDNDLFDIQIATHTVPSNFSISHDKVTADKKNWLYNNILLKYPLNIKNFYSFTGEGDNHKKVLAHSRSILIDDYHKNIKCFNNCGGIGVQVDPDGYDGFEIINKLESVINNMEK